MKCFQKTYRLVLLMLIIPIFIQFIACKQYMPYFPYSSYNTFYRINEFTNDSIKNKLIQVNDGYYSLDIFKNQTVFGRTTFYKYTTTKVDAFSEKQDSLFLYFIDEYRFYYTSKKINTIDIFNDIDKHVRVGIYNSYSARVNNENLTYVELYMALPKKKKS